MDIPQAIYMLQKATFSSDIVDHVLQKYNGYFMRILQSRMNSTIHTDENIQTDITRVQIVHREQINSQQNMPKQKALRMQELLTRLSRSKLIKQRNALIQMLIKLSSFKDNKQIDVLFKNSRDLSMNTSINSSTNSSLIQMKKSLMEIEASNEHTLQRQKPQEQGNQIMKTLKNVTDKGNTQIALREVDLVSDCLYCFQGIEGHNIIYDVATDGFVVRKDIPVSLPTRRIVNQLCEIGWLYMRVQSFLKDQTDINCNPRKYGIIGCQSKQIRQQGQSQQLIQYLLRGKDLTLRKLFLWSRNPSTQMTNLGILVSTINSHQSNSNSQELIISTLVSLQRHGCPIAHALYYRLLSATCVPLLRFINRWVFEGALDSPEFFVEREERNAFKEPGEQWKREYFVREERVPSILTREQAQLTFDTGRVVNWIHKQCQYKTWQMQLSHASVEQLLLNFQSQTQQSFDQWLRQANELTNQQLIDLVFNQLKFSIHLQAIKRYLLLGQGEFIHTLMSIMENELSKPAISIYRHNLIGLLESAIRSSNVQYLPPEILQRLDVKLLESSTGDSGWEVFCLDYRIDQPLNTILNQKAMNNYLRIFNFLWRVKRVEYIVAQAWKHQMESEKQLRRVREFQQSFVLCNQIRHQMQHFISNFYSYIMVEAVETAWTKFIAALQDAKNLDSVINLHEQFQNDVLDGAFLTQKHEIIYRQVLKVFDLIYRFKFMQEVLIQNSNDWVGRNKSADINKKLRSIVGSTPSNKMVQQPNKKNQESVKLLNDLYQEYKVGITEFQEKLRKDDKLKFLSFRLDFNEYYYNLNESHFNMELDKFVGMYIQNPQAQIQPQQQTKKSNIQAPIQSIQHNSQQNLQHNIHINMQQNIQQTSNLKSYTQTRSAVIEPVFVQNLTGKAKDVAISNMSIKNVAEGFKMLEEQKKQNLLMVEKLKKQMSMGSKMEEEDKAKSMKVSDMYMITRQDHERMKNDEDDLKHSSDDEIENEDELNDEEDNQFDNDDYDDDDDL